MEELIILINDYLFYVQKVASIFSEEFDVEIFNLLQERRKKIPFRGAIKHREITHYSFHGFGLGVIYKKKNIDFDFYFENQKCLIGGFDSWKLRNFAENDKVKYSHFLNESKIEDGLNILKELGLITKPQADISTSLWILNQPDF